jgi:hypothetical protein
MTQTLTDITDRLARNPRTAGAPRSCLELEAKNLLTHIEDSAEHGLPVTDAELEQRIEESLTRLEHDARNAAQAAQYETA